MPAYVCFELVRSDLNEADFILEVIILVLSDCLVIQLVFVWSERATFIDIM